jgi:long-chain fatty acid transport protein
LIGPKKNWKMKKALVLVICILSVNQIIAGGLVTNTNQSARFTRMLWRDATLGVDAVYFNPAILSRYEDGFYLSFNNQYINQNQLINNNYSYLTDSLFDYTGTVTAPLFPGVYAAYKIGSFTISGGFNPIGGGGGAEFPDGLPSLEVMVADLVPQMSSQLSLIDQTVLGQTGTDPGFRQIGGYNSNIYFKGSSVYYGYQANLSYAVSDNMSLAIGTRFVQARNTYKGSVSDVSIIAPDRYGGVQSPGNYLRYIAARPYIGAESPIGQSLLNNATQLDARTNIEADVIIKGTGLTPLVSMNYSPNENMNLSVKYEFKTRLELATVVNDGMDAGGMFIDGQAVVADIPAMLALGAAYTTEEQFTITAGLHYYFDKSNDYDGSLTREVNMIDRNSLEYGLGFDYALTDFLNVSAGWLGFSTGVNDLYQSDQRFSLNSNTLGGGVGIRISENIDFDLGGSYTMYRDGQRAYIHNVAGQNMAITENYSKSTFIVAAGINLYFEYY